MAPPPSDAPHPVLITGGTGYLRRALIPALVHAVEHPPGGVRVVDLPEIRRAQAKNDL